MFNITFFPYAILITAIFSKRISAMVTGNLTYYITFIILFSLTYDFMSTPK